MEVNDKKDAIKMLLSEFIKDGYFSDIKELISKALERENSGCTAIGNHVAIPHFRIKGISTSLVVCGVLKKGESIDWNAPDNLGVKYIFLVVSPEDDTQIHLQTLQKITKFALEPKALQDIAVEQGGSSLSELFIQYENEENKK